MSNDNTAETTSVLNEINSLRRELAELKQQLSRNNSNSYKGIKPKNKSTGWTGAYISNGSLVVTIEQFCIPETLSEVISNENWKEYRNGTKKLDTVAKIARNETLMLKVNSEWLSFQLPEAIAKKLAALSEKHQVSFIDEMKVTLWKKHQRITFNFGLKLSSLLSI